MMMMPNTGNDIMDNKKCQITADKGIIEVVDDLGKERLITCKNKITLKEKITGNLTTMIHRQKKRPT